MMKKEATKRWKADLAFLRGAHQELRLAIAELDEFDLSNSSQA
ncbi:MAG: hypothetical protein WA476_02825 [Acidobacteriaceae bacterium]